MEIDNLLVLLIVLSRIEIEESNKSYNTKKTFNRT